MICQKIGVYNNVTNVGPSPFPHFSKGEKHFFLHKNIIIACVVDLFYWYLNLLKIRVFRVLFVHPVWKRTRYSVFLWDLKLVAYNYNRTQFYCIYPHLSYRTNPLIGSLIVLIKNFENVFLPLKISQNCLKITYQNVVLVKRFGTK